MCVNKYVTPRKPCAAQKKSTFLGGPGFSPAEARLLKSALAAEVEVGCGLCGRAYLKQSADAKLFPRAYARKIHCTPSGNPDAKTATAGGDSVWLLREGKTARAKTCRPLQELSLPGSTVL
jgi:hypothetical protein